MITSSSSIVLEAADSSSLSPTGASCIWSHDSSDPSGEFDIVEGEKDSSEHRDNCFVVDVWCMDKSGGVSDLRGERDDREW